MFGLQLNVSFRFPTLHAYAVLLRESLGLAVDPAPDVPPLRGPVGPPDPELATQWLAWWRTILRESTPSGPLDDPALGDLGEPPYALDRYPRLQAAAGDDDHIRTAARQTVQSWLDSRPWPPPIPSYSSFLDALREYGLHRWRVRRRVSRKLGVSFKDSFALIALPVPGTWAGHTDKQVLLSTGLAHDYDAAARWLQT